MVISEHLEFNSLKKILVGYCQAEMTKDSIYAIEPLASKKKIRYSMDIIEEFCELIKDKVAFNLTGLEDIGRLFSEHEHSFYNFEELKPIYTNISIANRISDLTAHLSKESLVYELLAQIQSLPELEKRFHEIFTPEGEIKDTASPKLKELRNKRKTYRNRIRASLKKKIEELDKESFLFDKIITQRNERFVVPVKDSAVSFVKGIVHGRSSSRSSVFMEPMEIVEYNNEIEVISDEERYEIKRILTEFSQSIRLHSDEIVSNNKILKQIDFYHAIGRWAIEYKAKPPQISDSVQIKLKQARHPLLIHSYNDINKVIPFDLELGDEYKILVLSGPNMGGKTVTLKTVGLLTLMALSGLPITAKHSEIGIFDNIYADIGDNQSLENAMSTFSSHASNLIEMSKSTSGSMVLIDEIGSSTDPEQGSAIALAIMERLVENGAIGLITTHYSALKVYAEETEGCINASMQFDREKHVPTYQFQYGIPGDSFAIEIAKNLGMDDNIITRAREIIGDQHVDFTALLKRITEEKAALEQESFLYRQKSRHLDRKAEEYQKKLDALEEAKKNLKKKSLQSSKDFLNTMQKEIYNELQAIRDTDKKEKKKLATRAYDKVASLSAQMKREEKELNSENLQQIADPRIGERVWVENLDVDAEITEISGNNVKVDIGGIFVSVPTNSLYKLPNKQHDRPIQTRRNTPRREQTKFELNLIGNTFEEAQPKLDTFIDQAMLGGLEMVRIVHGKGTGVLRRKVRKHLFDNDNVGEMYSPAPESGGEGVTVVKLKYD
jgi:DNA mismatch repair protein MutS2